MNKNGPRLVDMLTLYLRQRKKTFLLTDVISVFVVMELDSLKLVVLISMDFGLMLHNNTCGLRIVLVVPFQLCDCKLRKK